MRQAPAFWAQPESMATRLLMPLAWAYALAGRLRCALARPVRMRVPVICVGNLVMGGAGKTPTVAALVALLRERGHTPHILSRGYGGRVRGVVRVDAATHSAALVGDEPLLLAGIAPCWVGRNRVDTARCAIDAGASVLVMDDGFQNPSLHKDCSLMVIDGGYGFGNSRVFPAGPLREPRVRGLERAQAVVLVGRDAHQIIPTLPRHLRVLRASLIPQPLQGGEADAARYLAFAGIARPQKFYDTAREVGLTLCTTHDFPDHHPFTQAELESLEQQAAQHGAALLTTQKDWLRLDDDWRARVAYLPVRMEIQPRGVLTDMLEALWEGKE